MSLVNNSLFVSAIKILMRQNYLRNLSMKKLCIMNRGISQLCTKMFFNRSRCSAKIFLYVWNKQINNSQIQWHGPIMHAWKYSIMLVLECSCCTPLAVSSLSLCDSKWKQRSSLWKNDKPKCHDDVINMKSLSALLALLWGESTGHRWIPLTTASDAELWCFLWSAPENGVEQTIRTPVIWDAIALIMMSL